MHDQKNIVLNAIMEKDESEASRCSCSFKDYVNLSQPKSDKLYDDETDISEVAVAVTAAERAQFLVKLGCMFEHNNLSDPRSVFELFGMVWTFIVEQSDSSPMYLVEDAWANFTSHVRAAEKSV